MPSEQREVFNNLFLFALQNQEIVDGGNIFISLIKVS